MSRKYLLLDSPYLCHRMKHAMGDLSFKGSATGIIYGFLKSLSGFQDLFNTSNFVFCWDSRTNKRKEIYPEYKANREQEEYTEEETIFHRAFQKQMKKLRTTYLPTIGFRNIFIQKGYESDDIIASIAQYSIREEDEAIIITSDKDLYQCIRPNVSFYNPQTGKILTLQGFKKQYGIHPIRWSMVITLAGCATDNVKGIKGVGEKTAIKYMLGNLNPKTKVYEKIVSPGVAALNRSQLLVTLPFEGTNIFKLRRDKLSEQGWKVVCQQLGMKSIRDRMPFGKRRK